MPEKELSISDLGVTAAVFISNLFGNMQGFNLRADEQQHYNGAETGHFFAKDRECCPPKYSVLLYSNSSMMQHKLTLDLCEMT